MWSMVNGIPKRDNFDFMSADQAASYRSALYKVYAKNSAVEDGGAPTGFDAAAGSGRDGLAKGVLGGDGVLTQQEMDNYNIAKVASDRQNNHGFLGDLFDGIKELAGPAALAGLAIASGGASAGFMSSIFGGEAAAGGAAALGEGAGAATVADAATTAAANSAFGSSLSGYAGAAGAAGVADAATTAAGNSAFGDSLAGYGGGGATVADAATTAAANSTLSSSLSGYAGTAATTAAGGLGASQLFNGAKTGMSALGSLLGGGGSALGSLLGGGSGALGPQLGNIGSNLLSANGANQAAQTQANAATQTIAMQQGMFDKSQQNLQPYMAGGAQAMGQLNGKLADGSLGGTFTGADYLANKDPGYEFQLNQGNQALQNSQAARDGVLGGSSLKGLIDYNQGAASTGYQSAYQRWLSSQQNTYGQLSGAAGIGANAAGAGANNASRFAGNIGDAMTGRGNSLAAGQVGQAKAYSQMTSGAGNMMYALRDMVNPSGSPYSAPTNASPYMGGPSQQQGYGLGSEFDQYKSQSPSDSQ